MECLSDFGTVSFFSVSTLTTGIYNSWLSFDDLNSANQISFILLIFILFLFSIEIYSRKEARYHQPGRGFKPINKIKLTGKKSNIAFLFCSLVFFISFIFPVSQMMYWTFKFPKYILEKDILRLNFNTIILVGISGFTLVLISLFTNYGNRIEGDNLKDTYSITRSENFSEESKRRIVGGNQVLSQGFSDEIYLNGLNLRDQIANNFEKDFKEVDIILSPVTPNSPPKIGDSLKDPLTMYLSDAYTVGFSLGQLPTLTIPKGTATGLQISAAKNNDELVLQFANFLNDLI